jgi:hypothetical protein
MSSFNWSEEDCPKLKEDINNTTYSYLSYILFVYLMVQISMNSDKYPLIFIKK